MQDESAAVKFSLTGKISTEATNGDIIIVSRDISIGQYFFYLDSIVAVCNERLNYKISEHILVCANPWIIDTLVNSDYYKQKERGNFIYDQRMMIVLQQGDTLLVPDAQQAAPIQSQLESTVIDVNIPEYKLRIIERDTVKYSFSVRVGRNERKYLKTAKRVVSLQTPIGEGEIARVERIPIFVNPVTGNYTLMPQIPWLESSTGGKRLGALIHPTTNPETLGKTYSNGCIGTAEGDAWLIYYHAPSQNTVKS